MIKGTGKEFKAKVVDGKAVFDLPKFTKVGTFTLRAAYLGSDLLTKADKLGGHHRHQVAPHADPTARPALAGTGRRRVRPPVRRTFPDEAASHPVCVQ